MDGRLSTTDRKTLERFVNTGAKDFNLLYSFTRDGADVTTFHQKCDNKGPTVTVIYNTKRSVYGGYTEKSWTSDAGTFYRDEKAFLFRLKFDEKEVWNKFPVNNPDKAIQCNKDNGPIFGSGPDMNVFTGSLEHVKDTGYTLNGSTSFGSAYDMGGISTEQITSNIQTVLDLEVYSLTESPLANVWRESPGWKQKDLDGLKHEIEAYAPPHPLGMETANILVLGPVGAGKSSFFNTVASVFRGHIANQAVCGSAEQSITSKYRMYRVRGSAMTQPLKFCLCDTRGLEENLGIDGQELNFILEGNVPDGYEFNPTKQISSDVHGFVTSPTLTNKIHCVCFVLDGTTATVLPEKMVEKIKILQMKVRQKGLPQAIVLTKIDNVCSHVEEDVTDVYRSNAIRDLVDKVSGIFGVSRNQVLPMKNYEKEVYVRTDVSILALHTLSRLLLSTENYLFNFLDQLDKKKRATDSLE